MTEKDEKYFISYIWWHKHRRGEKNFAETVTSKTPLQWLLDMRGESDRLAEEEFKEHPTRYGRVVGEEFHILFAITISEIDYKKAKDIELGE